MESTQIDSGYKNRSKEAWTFHGFCKYQCDEWLYDHLSACKTVLFITGLNCITSKSSQGDLISYFFPFKHSENMNDVIFM